MIQERQGNAALDMFLYAGIKKDEYNNIKDIIYKNGYITFKILTIFLTIILFFMALVSVFIPSLKDTHLFYASSFIAFFIVTILYLLFVNPRMRSLNFIIYAIAMLGWITVIALSAFYETEKESVTYLVALILSSLLFSDRPFRYTLMIVVVETAFLIAVCLNKTDVIKVNDVVNSIVTTIISIALNMFQTHLKYKNMNNYTILSKKRMIEKSINEETQNQKDEQIDIYRRLSSDFVNVMHVNLSTNKVLGFYDNKLSKLSDKELSTIAFDDQLKMYTDSIVVEKDRDMFFKQMERNTLIKYLETNEVLLIRYRIKDGNKESHYETKVVKDNSKGNECIVVIAAHNVDKEVEKEQKLNKTINEVKHLANSDALTGAMNKSAYIQATQDLMKDIFKGNIEDFAIVMCDINDLKITNDTYGHDVGDILIINAYRLIKESFNNTTVYRIGGDEFVVILKDENYANRQKYVNQIKSSGKQNKNGVSISVGLADYDPEKDRNVEQVFKRADDAMYQNKREMKGQY